MVAVRGAPRAWRRVVGLAVLVCAASCGGGGGVGGSAEPPEHEAAPTMDIVAQAISSPPEFVTGGAVLLQLRLPASADPASLRVHLNGAPAAVEFARDAAPGAAPDTWLGVLEKLPEGAAALRFDAADASGGPPHAGTLALTHQQRSAGVLTRPLLPLVCRTAALGLGEPTNADCDAPAVVAYRYRSRDPARPGLLVYDPANPPNDVASTTTDRGVTVPFIVRHERGVIDRTVYDLAVLADPARPWTATAPQPGWNHKLLWRFGGGCTPGHVQSASSASVLDDAYGALGKGFAVTTSGLSVLGNHCDTTLSAEAVLTIKSHIAVRYGRIRYTFGDGGSGGAIQQQAIANNAPGLLDGLILTGSSFPDVPTLATEFADCHLLRRYFGALAPALWPDAAQQAAVMGKVDLSSCTLVDTDAFGLGYSYEDALFAPDIGCNLPDNAVPARVAALPSPGVYNAQHNPRGVRCTYQDSLVAVFGTRAADGFANRIYDNVGVQYGLGALRSGAISLAQFIDLNERIGGLSIDNAFTAQRSAADTPALAPAYRSGQVIDARALGQVPIIAYQRHDNRVFHDSFNNATVRARLIESNGHAANQVIWTYPDDPAALPGDAFVQMDTWLAAIEADTLAGTRAEKVVRARPAASVDGCLIGGTLVHDAPRCAAIYPDYADPRLVAGARATRRALKCHLKPLDPSDYGHPGAPELARLHAAFPDGVCDHTLPGVDEQPTVPWSRWR